MDIVISCVWIAIEISAMFLFNAAFLRRRFSKRKTLGIMLVLYILAIFHDLSVFYTIPPLASKAVNVCVGILSSVLLFSAPWYSCAAVFVSGYFFLAAIDTLATYGISALLGISFSELMWKKSLFVLIVTAEKCFYYLPCWGLYRFRRAHAIRTPNVRRVILMTLFPLVSIIGIFQLYQNSQSQGERSASVVAFVLVLIIANAAVIYLMDSLDRTAVAEKELALLSQSKALQTESYRALEKSYRAQRAATHEFKHQLQLIGELLRDGHSGEALRYIDQLQGQQSTRILVANTGNTIVDAILNEKYQRAKEQNIDVRYHVSDLSALRIHTDALVVLLSNLLDNAIEACVRLPEGRIIECSLVLEDSLLLSVRNTAPSVQIADGRIETTKEPKAEHGFGLTAVARIVQQLQGEYALDYSEPWFQIVAEIPNT